MIDPDLPKFDPLTGERLVDVRVTCERERHRMHALPPVFPMREIFDDDGNIVGELPIEEYADLLAAFEAADKRWRQTMGVVVQVGRATWTARGFTRSGRVLDFVSDDGKAWHLVAAEGPTLPDPAAAARAWLAEDRRVGRPR